MQNAIGTIEFPELFFGFVAPVGTEINPTISEFEAFFRREGYHVIKLKVTDYFKSIKDSLGLNLPLDSGSVEERIVNYIRFGNEVRSQFGDDSVLAAYTIFRIRRRRNVVIKKTISPKFQKVVYLLHQFKRKEEIDFLRAVYGRLFFQVSIHSKRETRLYNLSKKIAHGHNSPDHLKFMSVANDLLVKDENEVGE